MPDADEVQPKIDAAKEQSQQVVEHAGEQARQVTDVARQQAGEVARQATDRGRAVLRDAGRELQTHADSQAERASDALRDVSRQLRSMVAGSDEGGRVVDLAWDAADRTEKFARRLDDGGAKGLLDDALEFARRRPGVFLLGATAAGFGIGRLLRNADLEPVKQAATSGSDPDPAANRQLSPSSPTPLSQGGPAGSLTDSRDVSGGGGPVTAIPPR